MLRKPELSPDLDAVFRAFFDLSRDRQTGFAIGPIPWTSMDRYAERAAIDGDQFDRFAELIKVLDLAWLKFVGEKSRTQSPRR